MNENHKHDIIYLSSFFAVFSLGIILAVISNAYPYLMNANSKNVVVVTTTTSSSTADITQLIDDY